MASKSINLQLPDPIQETSTKESAWEVVKAPKRANSTLMGYADVPLTQAQQERANVKLFR